MGLENSFDELQKALKQATADLSVRTPWSSQTVELYKSIEEFLYTLQITTSTARYEYHAAKIAFDRSMKALDRGPDQKWNEVI